MDASNLLKPALAGGAIRCIGSTTYKEYRNYFEKDRALVRRFQKIDVNEPTVEDSVKILRGLKPYYERHHKVRYTSDALRAAVELSHRYIGDRKLPDKAIDVIDETGAAQMLVPESRRRKTITAKRGRGLHRDDGADPAKERVARRSRGAEESGPRSEDDGLRSGHGDRGTGLGDQAGACRAARSREADRQLSVFRPDRRRQDRGRAPARPRARHRDHSLRHVRVHGAAYRVAADRRAARLCRLRSGRAVDRCDRPAPPQRAAARRDREGASRSLQHPACRSWITES